VRLSYTLGTACIGISRHSLRGANVDELTALILDDIAKRIEYRRKALDEIEVRKQELLRELKEDRDLLFMIRKISPKA